MCMVFSRFVCLDVRGPSLRESNRVGRGGRKSAQHPVGIGPCERADKRKPLLAAHGRGGFLRFTACAEYFPCTPLPICAIIIK